MICANELADVWRGGWLMNCGKGMLEIEVWVWKGV